MEDKEIIKTHRLAVSGEMPRGSEWGDSLKKPDEFPIALWCSPHRTVPTKMRELFIDSTSTAKTTINCHIY